MSRDDLTAARLAAGTLALGVGYYLLAKLGSATQLTGGVQVAWLPVGFAAAALYLGDLRWFAGATLADLLLGTGVVPFHANKLNDWATVQTLGNTVEFTVAALLMRRWLGPRNRLERPLDVGLLLLALAIGTAVSATVGTLTVWGSGDATAHELPTVFRTWWLGDTAGGLLVAPLVLVWVSGPRLPRPTPRKALEVAAILAMVAGLSILAFDSDHPLTYMVFPALILAALNLGQRGATAALVVAVAVAITRTADDAGPFVTRSIDDETLNAQLYILIATITTLTIGAVVSARRQAALELADARRREAERGAEERQRIAGDLHDSVSQTLFSLGLHAGIAKHHAAREHLPEDGPLRGAVDEVADLAQHALVEMRASIFELRGDALAEQGLVAALQAHAAAIAVRHDVAVSVDGPEDRLELEPAVEELLYRIGQEAITNAVKHSRSDMIDVRVEARDDEVVLTVRDAGVGFDPRAAYAGHLGLDLMRSRAAEAGGLLEIDSAPGRGTSLRMRIPRRAATRSATPSPPVPPVAPPASVT